VKSGKSARARGAWSVHVLGLSILVTGTCEALLLYDVVSDTFYFDLAAPWIDRGRVEMAVVVALAVALIAIGKSYRDLLSENRSYQATVKLASGQLFQVITTKFRDWGLSESERDIALMLIKGFSVQEISELRNTRPGTVKSQSNAVYRKAGVSGRNELVAYFVEDLLAGDELVGDASRRRTWR
jgi:DNA-binding CsgD family transcriptional regulator